MMFDRYNIFLKIYKIFVLRNFLIILMNKLRVIWLIFFYERRKLEILMEYVLNM